MSGDGKKISFSFSKVKKPTLAKKVNIEPKEKIEYVDCFDGAKGTFSYKGNVKNDNETKKELVIPLISSKTSTDIVKSRIEEKASKNLETNGSRNLENSQAPGDSSKNLEELAAQEILKEVNSDKGGDKNSSKLVIETKELEEAKDSSEFDIDYDSVPVTDFGMAMLRGMGWKPNAGIGKEPKLVATVSPKLRPKGLGLGAKPVPETTEKEDEQKPK